MTLAGRRIVLTGATGGIGSALTHVLARAGAQLLLVGRNTARLEGLAAALRRLDATAHCVAVDLCHANAAAAVAQRARLTMGGTDILVNNAGIGRFQLFETEDPAAIEMLFCLNLLAPMCLARALLPEMIARGDGHIVNIGSTFGRLAFPGYAAYSAAKHGLRGWSEALRRELAGSGVDVSYVAPRATHTGMNDARVDALNSALRTTVDEPTTVAAQIAQAIVQRRAQVQLGWPEKLLVHVNALLPRLIDRALAARLGVIKQHAQPARASLKLSHTEE